METLSVQGVPGVRGGATRTSYGTGSSLFGPATGKRRSSLDDSETDQPTETVKKTHKEDTPEKRRQAKLIEKIKLKYLAENMVRIPLPAFESIQTDLEFPLSDGPPRVVARIERIMGSDVAKLLDKNWMSALLDGLVNEEDLAMEKRMEIRANGELERSRRLAINGLIEPGVDMKSVRLHPLYRVNKLMKRLSKMNYNVLLHQQKLPPITPIDPFIYDDTGEIFKSYPGHEPIDVGELPDLSESAFMLYQELEGDIPSNYGEVGRYLAEADNDDDEVEEGDESVLKPEEPEEPETVTLYSKDGDEEEEEEYAGEDGPEEYIDEALENVRAANLAYADSLETLQRRFGIEDGPNLKIYEAFQSHLVDTLDIVMGPNEEGNVYQLYEMAEEIVGFYNREVLTATDACVQLSKAIEEYHQLNFRD